MAGRPLSKEGPQLSEPAPCQCRGSPGSVFPCTSNKLRLYLMCDLTITPLVTVVMHMWYSRRYNYVDHTLDPITPFPACAEGTFDIELRCRNNSLNE